jgi:uncharacterized DUF497 family protein
VRHGVSREEIEQAISGDTVDLNIEYSPSGEKRVTIAGLTAKRKVVIVVYTIRRKRIRPITAWPASRKEEALLLRSLYGPEAQDDRENG